MFLRKQSGFNLVELMVVVAIIGILSSVAVPRFATFKARATQTEARGMLNGIFLSMQAYEANYSTFPQASSGCTARGTNGIFTGGQGCNIGFKIQGNQPKYIYYLKSQSGLNPGWVAMAVSENKLANDSFDVMRINANKLLCSPFDAVTLKRASNSVGAADYCPDQFGTDGQALSNTVGLNDLQIKTSDYVNN